MESSELLKCANAVLLPAFADTSLSEEVKSFLSNGGCSILLGESREEYLARSMSDDRKNKETARTIRSLTDEAKSIQTNLIVAVDQEIYGIQRLQHLGPVALTLDELKHVVNTDDFQLFSRTLARIALSMGINCFLAPILDVVTGENPWLKNRTWSTDPIEILNLTSAFIRGIQQDNVISSAKHFPGFSNIELDPAIDKNAVMDGSLDSIKEGYIPFVSAIENNVEMIMVGPAIVKALDEFNPASLSPTVISILRNDLNFDGIILSDDLDAKATLQHSTIEQVAVRALNAGCDFLLLADIENQISRVANAIVEAVKSRELDEGKLIASAGKVKVLAKNYS